MVKKILLFSFISLYLNTGRGQQPNYTFRHFVRELDTSEFKITYPKGKDGLIRTYVQSGAEIWDLDDDNKTYVRGNESVVLCIEGQRKSGKREGIFTFYVIDSLDHSRRYKIWEQEYHNDKLNGPWKTYTLRGTLVEFQTYKDDSLNGIARTYWIDGKKIMDEKQYFNGTSKYVQKEFYDNGKVKIERPYENGKLTGTGRNFYEDGTIEQEVNLKNGKMDGIRKYYFPNGQLWIEEIYKDDKNWTVVANYTDKGVKRNPGTLKNGNGTIIYYNEDGTIWKTSTFVNGEEVK